MLPFRARVDLGAMAKKGCSAFPKPPALLESHHQIVYCHIQDTRWESLTPQQRCSQCIPQPQLTCLKILLVALGEYEVKFVTLTILGKASTDAKTLQDFWLTLIITWKEFPWHSSKHTKLGMCSKQVQNPVTLLHSLSD